MCGRLLMGAITELRGGAGSERAARTSPHVRAGKRQHEEAWRAAPHLAELLSSLKEDERLQYVKHWRRLTESCCQEERHCVGSSGRLSSFCPFGNLTVVSLQQALCVPALGTGFGKAEKHSLPAGTCCPSRFWKVRMTHEATESQVHASAGTERQRWASHVVRTHSFTLP